MPSKYTSPFLYTWQTWNNRKALNLAKSSILKWPFRCSCRGSLQCRRFWWSIEWFAAILDSLQTGRIGAGMTECRRGGGRGRKNKIFLSPPPSPIFLSLSHPWWTFYLAPTFHCFSISRWRPEHPMETYIHSPRQNPPALQAIAVEAFLTIYFKSTSWMHSTVESIWQFILLIRCINSAQMSVSLKSLAYQVRFGSKLLFRNFQDVSKWGRLCCGQFDFLVKFCGFQYLQSKAKICSRSKNSSLLVPCENGKSTFCEFGDN